MYNDQPHSGIFALILTFTALVSAAAGYLARLIQKRRQ